MSVPAQVPYIVECWNMLFVHPFHAAAGPDHTLFGDTEIHGPDGKLAPQGEQTSVCVCKSFVA